MGRKKSLKFDKKYVKQILEGEKVTTLRRTTRLKPGDVVDLVAGGEVFGEAMVTDVKRVRLSALTDEEARRDGFESKDRLIKELRRIYGKKIEKEDQLWMIEFRLLSGESEEEE
ncbi:MAG TPA: ASCH domain-containing protein [Candidatus Korarchaeota archaeon]|nr:ASCH domain-containing protein [Candidatus Korarchaeota archaeon]